MVQEDEEVENGDEALSKENEETRLQALTALQDIESVLIDFKNKYACSISVNSQKLMS
jgi:hypothetical protein